MNFNDRATAVLTTENKVGQITKIYGVNGELVVKVWDNFPQNIIGGDFTEPLWIEINSIATPFFVTSFKAQGSSKAVVTIEDLGSEALAAIVVGRDIYAEIVEILDDTMGSDLDYLVGFAFVDLTSGKNGVVAGVIESKMNPLLEIEIEGEEVLVPIAEPLIEKLSRRRRTLTMRLAAGTLEF